MNDYNKETYVICFRMYVSDWSAVFCLVEAVQQAPGHPTLPGLHSWESVLAYKVTQVTGCLTVISSGSELHHRIPWSPKKCSSNAIK